MTGSEKLISDHPLLARPRSLLADYKRTTPQHATLLRELAPCLASIKRTAVTDGDQHLAKAVWCLETVAAIQRGYLRVFTLLKKSRFYAAWRELEIIELTLRALAQHFTPFDESYGLAFIRITTARWQSLYPYSVFASPEIWKREVRCGLCDAVISLRKGCGHQPGEIYDGERCFRRVTGADVLAIAIVHNPVQKYSVLFTADPAASGGKPNKEAYPLLQYVIKGLSSPWNEWKIERTTIRHPHVRYRDADPNEACPCVNPQGSYAQCCLPQEGVLRPHVVVQFSVPPPSKFLKRVYA
ncbi:hypothetical protein [Hymenobacter profundi]|uniref:Zinc chelation protein SecC n=1 Tax=Hymenobacter profundi TaxID=1982110 RepID=A0ABS6WWP4_9BACT|nr:hypothetical protein [Hymenobacter profundi]MBW3127198.1 hypothetical protein [Hymenobacter profundi]